MASAARAVEPPAATEGLAPPARIPAAVDWAERNPLVELAEPEVVAQTVWLAPRVLVEMGHHRVSVTSAPGEAAATLAVAEARRSPAAVVPVAAAAARHSRWWARPMSSTPKGSGWRTARSHSIGSQRFTLLEASLGVP